MVQTLNSHGVFPSNTCFFFFFCTLVHRSALDFEPGTKRHNIWYPVQELLEMLPYGWAKLSQSHLWMEGLDREGKMAKRKNVSPHFLLEWKWKWEFKVLCFNPPNTRKQLKIFLGVFESSIFKMPAKAPNNCKTKRGSKLTDIPPYCWKILKPKFWVPCSLVKGKIT